MTLSLLKVLAISIMPEGSGFRCSDSSVSMYILGLGAYYFVFMMNSLGYASLDMLSMASEFRLYTVSIFDICGMISMLEMDSLVQTGRRCKFKINL